MDDDERREAEDRLTELLVAGMEYQGRGWHVFALGPDKVPIRNCGTAQCRNHVMPSEMLACHCLTCHGCYAATLDGETLARQLEVAGPEASLGLATGRRSGVVVVDLDPTPERPLVVLRGALIRYVRGSNPARSRTPRGGEHLFYAYPKRDRISNSVGKLTPGVDIRSDGGYVVLAPSAGRTWVTPPGEILDPLPARLVAKLNKPLVERDVAQDWATNRGHLRTLAAFVANAPPGERNNSLYWAVRRAAEEIEQGCYDLDRARVALCEAAEQAGLSPREALSMVNRAFRTEHA